MLKHGVPIYCNYYKGFEVGVLLYPLSGTAFRIIIPGLLHAL